MQNNMIKLNAFPQQLKIADIKEYYNHDFENNFGELFTDY